MAHYAFLDQNNIVTEVIVGIDENELIEGKKPEDWYAEFRGQKCVRTSFNGKIRGVFAAIGFYYDQDLDLFITPQPFKSWIQNGSFWVAPKPKPEGLNWYWDEESGDWLDGEAL